jgi:hypothetical protein
MFVGELPAIAREARSHPTLFNAREPMTLFELQQWLGHKHHSSTQHYINVTPTKLMNSYAKAGYFERNVRAIEVLIDQDIVRKGLAGQEPWSFFDLVGVDIAPMTFSINARTGWPVHNAPSMCPRTPPVHICWRQRAISYDYDRTSRSPNPNWLRLMTESLLTRNYWPDYWMYPHPTVRLHADLLNQGSIRLRQFQNEAHGLAKRLTHRQTTGPEERWK